VRTCQALRENVEHLLALEDCRTIVKRQDSRVCSMIENVRYLLQFRFVGTCELANSFVIAVKGNLELLKIRQTEDGRVFVDKLAWSDVCSK
jgi:hypothetical protein